MSQPWDHPRSRGENLVDPTDARLDGGSSPLTRGKPAADSVPSTRVGIIPAHAGKTCWAFLKFQPPEDHPRSRGENLGLLVLEIAAVGSSPLTRGKRLGFLSGDLAAGIIPAHAGKTVIVSLAVWVSGDHPRSRGENGQGARTDLRK